MSGEISRLHIGADISPEDALRAFLSVVDAEKTWKIEAEFLNKEKTDLYAFAHETVSYLDIAARNILSPMHRDSGKDSLGFSTYVLVFFEKKKDALGRKPETEDFLLNHSLKLVDTIEIDLALTLWDSDWLALRRVNNQLFLNFKHPIWTPKRLAWVTKPYISESVYLSP